MILKRNNGRISSVLFQLKGVTKDHWPLFLTIIIVCIRWIIVERWTVDRIVDSVHWTQYRKQKD